MSATVVVLGVFGLGLCIALATPVPRLGSAAELTMPVGSPWALAVAIGILGGFVWGSPTLVLAAPVAIYGLRIALGRHSQRVQRERMHKALPAFTDELCQQLQSGWSLSASLTAGASASPPIGAMLQPALDALSAGERLENALANVNSNDEALRIVLVTLRVLVATGSPATKTIERLGENVRAVLAAEEEAQALASQGTASAVVLAALPVLFATLAAAGDADMARLYAFEWLGAVCVTSSILLTGLGWFWMDALVWGHRR